MSPSIRPFFCTSYSTIFPFCLRPTTPRIAPAVAICSSSSGVIASVFSFATSLSRPVRKRSWM